MAYTAACALCLDTRADCVCRNLGNMQWAPCVRIALDPGAEKTRELLDALERSGMRRLNCSGCGCEMLTRRASDKCPPCAQQESDRAVVDALCKRVEPARSLGIAMQAYLHEFGPDGYTLIDFVDFVNAQMGIERRASSGHG